MKKTRKTSIAKIIPMALIVIYTILMIVAIALFTLPMDKSVLAYIGICSTMLLTDIGKTITDTYNMKKGDFKKIYTPYYICCEVCTVALIFTIGISGKKDIYTDEVSTLLASIGIVIAEYIGALLGNKLATGVADGNNSVGTDQEVGK